MPLDYNKFIKDLARAHAPAFEALLSDLEAAAQAEAVVFEDPNKTLMHTYMREGKIRLLRDLRDKLFKQYDRRP
jgi:hypothetical protein